MAKRIRSDFCHTCKAPRAFVREGPNHVLHLLLSFFTVGFWLPVWALICLLSVTNPSLCVTCGISLGVNRRMRRKIRRRKRVEATV